MKYTSTLILLFALTMGLNAQVLTSNTGKIHLVAVEDTDVDATSQSFTGKIDLDKKSVVFSVPVQSFTFASSTMQRHFNEPNNMDSKQWPKIKFKGTMETEEDLTAEGDHEVTVNGEMTIRGTTKAFSAKGKIDVKDDTWMVKAAFNVDGTQYGLTNDFAHNIAIDMEVAFSE